MSQILVQNLTFHYEGSFDHIFENVSFSIDTNWKLGFIGRNGKGKTTFLQILLGKYNYEGHIDCSVPVAYFPYELTERQLEMTAAEFLDELRPNCEFWRVVCELNELQEDADVLYQPFSQLSFGQRTKILLAVLFSGENDFLLIDEPTNHLDENAREIVKKYLSCKRGFILVSHDRDLLDACVNHVLVLNRKTIELQNGNFSSWWENKERKDKFAEAENEKHRKEIKKLRQAARQTADWAAKNEASKIGFDPVKEHDRCISTRSYIGAKTKKMQSRVKQMERRINTEIEEKEGLLQDIEEISDLKLTKLTHYKNTLVQFRKFGIRYENAANPVFENMDFSLQQGDRIALHGKNGCGKSTLIRRILQSVGMDDGAVHLCDSGIMEIASGLKISYVCQDTAQLSGSIAEFCEGRGIDRSLFCAILRQLDFERTQFVKQISDFSEGQKKKVLLAASLLTPAHLYIWDEPLNYIDVFSRMQIEKLLLSYQPTMLFVEHDIRFRKTISTKTISFD